MLCIWLIQLPVMPKILKKVSKQKLRQQGMMTIDNVHWDHLNSLKILWRTLGQTPNLFFDNFVLIWENNCKNSERIYI